jgi:hypothetical protein
VLTEEIVYEAEGVFLAVFDENAYIFIFLFIDLIEFDSEFLTDCTIILKPTFDKIPEFVHRYVAFFCNVLI